MNFSSSYNKLVQYYNEKDLFRKIKKISGKLGADILYHVLVLYLLLSDKKVPYRKRLIIIAALGYFILPTDFVADFIPVIGFTDDISFLVFAVASVNEHISDEISNKARKAVEKLTGKRVSEEEGMNTNFSQK